MKVIVCVVVLVASVLSSGDVYDYSDQTGWGGVCTSGKKQSPIDVVTPKTETTVTTAILSLPTGADTAKMTNLNNKNTIKFSFPDSLTYKIPGMESVDGTLVQLHMHWGADDNGGSEHCLDGSYFAGEAHLVTSYTATDKSTKYAVVNRFFKVGAENAQVKQMIAASGTASGDDRNIAVFNASALFPSDIAAVLTYSGSLTTPTCDETVSWVIVPAPLTISTAQLSSLRTLKLGEGEDVAKTFNWRKKQDTNDRVVKCIKLQTKSSSIKALASPILLIAALIKLVM